ncbi:TonB-dependent receptor [Paludibacterium paludis]|uniref:Ferric-mycobactin receptor FemA n=1 Tax=Paludibacterium paludis TaxID=1225769 RepID=A0A918NZY4_9NEIS|nr:TonB-dependent receptor [Paludibacterium paludis]GGY09900.1 ferric-mycobactin receptor FemA [Paludibacterium paludis]
MQLPSRRPTGRPRAVSRMAAAIHFAFVPLLGLSVSAHADSIRYSVPPGRLAEVLNQFANQSGVTLAIDADTLRGQTSPGLNGRFTIDQGFDTLLTGSGYTVARTSAGYILVASPGAGGTQLPEVKVIAVAKNGELPGVAPGGQVAKGSRLGILGNRSVMDTPFNTTSYTARLMQDQQARTVSDVLVNDPSVRFMTPSGHLYENYSIRGFDVLSGEVALNGMYGLAPMGHVPTEFIERVELLKGPEALLTGMAPDGGVGGLINLVPKRAGDTPLTRWTTRFTSGSEVGNHLDVARRYGENQAFGVRFNGSYRDGKQGVQDQSKRSRLGALALDYAGERLRASLDTYWNVESMSGGSPMMASFGSTNVPKAPDAKTNILAGIHGEMDSTAIAARAEYDLGDALTAYAGAGTQRYRYHGFLNGTRAGRVDAQGDYTGETYFQRGYTDALSAEAGLRSRLNTGGVGHQWVAGATWLDLESGVAVGYGDPYASNIYHPARPILAKDPGAAPKTSASTLYSLSLADTLSFAGDRVQLTLGLRNQHIRSKSYNGKTGAQTSDYDKSALTPALAVVVKPRDGLSLYANYIEGLSRGDTVNDMAARNYGEVFAPYKTRQMEAGVKWDNGMLTHTVSLFQITRPSMLKNSATNTYSADARQRNRGLEWNVSGKVAPRLSVLGGMTFLQARLTKTANGQNDGKTAFGSPTWQTTLGLDWETPWLSGLGLSARTIHVGRQYLNAANTQTLPAWTRLDLGARYSMTWAGKDVILRAGVINVANTNAWAGTYHAEGYATQGTPRTVQLSATVDF